MPVMEIKPEEQTSKPLSKRWIILRRVFVCCAVIIFFYPTPFYRLFLPALSGVRSKTTNQEVSSEKIVPIKSGSSFQVRRLGYTYNLVPRANYELIGRVIDIDRYHGWWERFAHGHDIGRVIYNALAPLDLVIGYQKMAEPATIKNFNFSHEYRLMWWQPKQQLSEMSDLLRMFNNFHIVPATPKIAWATKSIMRGDVVRFKGKLVDVTSSQYDWWNLTTGTGHDQYHKDFYGGQYATMCFIVYLEELQIGQYVYK